MTPPPPPGPSQWLRSRNLGSRNLGSRNLRTRNLHNLPALLVLACAAGGLVYSAIAPEHWLRGVLFMAGALIMGGVFRMVLPTRQAGLLAVRGRMVDVLCYAGTGVALWVVGLLLPPTRS